MSETESNREYWFIWTMANAIGVAVGVFLTETFAPIYPQITWLLFSAPIWVIRWAAIRSAPKFKAFRKAELILWSTGEFFGHLIGLGIQENGGGWLTLGPVFGLFIGPQMWLLFRIITVAHSQKDQGLLRWFIASILLGIGGLLLSGVISGLGISLFTEILELTRIYLPSLMFLIAGFCTGMIVGAITAFSQIGLFRVFKPTVNS